MTPSTILSRRHALAALASAAVLGAHAQPQPQALPQPAPSDAINLVVGYTKGGSVDLVARSLAEAWSGLLPQPVGVVNIPGASGMLGAVQVGLGAPESSTLLLGAVQVGLGTPESSTLLLGSPSEIGINSSLDRRIRFDPLKDTTPIVLVGSQPMVLVVPARLAVADTAAFLAHARSRPGMAFTSSGRGTPLHLAGELIAQRAGLKMRHVPLPGAAPMVEAMLDGRVDCGVLVLSSALPYLRDGRLRAIGLTTPQRNRSALSIPALAEDPHLQGLDIGVWFGVLGPPRMAAARADGMRRQLRTVLKQPALRGKLEASGLTMAEDTDFPEFLRSEIKKFKGIVEAAGLAG